MKETILGVDFDAVTLKEAVTRALVFLSEENKQHVVVTPNPEIVLYAHHHPEFKKLLAKASLSIPDGTGIVWASAYKNGMLPPGKLKGRVTGVDFMSSLIEAVSDGEIRIFLLGAAPDVAEKVAEVFNKKYPLVSIVGTMSSSPKESDFAEIKEKLEVHKPHLLFVAYGSPKQEEWIFAHLKKLPFVRLAVGVGGAFDFIAGTRKRAPKFMQKLSLEWLYRLLQQPTRIKRIFNAVVRFPLTVLKFHR